MTLTPRPGAAGRRNGAMTPIPDRQVPRRTLKSMQEPPFQCCRILMGGLRRALLTGGGGSGAGIGPVERSPAGSGRDRVPGWRRGRPAATSPPSPMGVAGFFSGRSRGVLHIGARRHRGPIRSFPHDSKALPRMSVFSGRAPMCRGARSAHGRISAALNAGAFPHDSADPPRAGPRRMCSTAPTGPLPRIDPGSTAPISHGRLRHRPRAPHTLLTTSISGDGLLEYARAPGMTPAVPGAPA